MTTRVKGSVASKASEILYDNTASGLTADNVKAALDEVASGGISGGDITAVDTVHDLLSLSAQDGELFLVREYFTDTDKGHGLFEFISTKAKADHNGGTVISPTVPWDGQRANLAGFLSGANETDVGGTGCFVRKYDGALNTQWFGTAEAQGIDDYEPLQKCFDTAVSEGVSVFLPGKSRTSAEITLDLQTTSTPISDNRPSVFGLGQGVSGILPTSSNITAFKIIGDLAGTAGALGYLSVNNIFIGGASGDRTTTGIELVGLAYASIEDCGFHGLGTCINITSSLSSSFNRCVFSEGEKGVVTGKGTGFSNFNACVFNACEFRRLTELAFDGFEDVTNLGFYNCQIEGNGTQGALTSGGAIIRARENAGGVAAVFDNCYIEKNAGAFDIKVTENDTSGKVSLILKGNSFNRIDSTKYVTNNIVTEGEVDVTCIGNHFASFNDYVVDPSREYFNLSTDSRHYVIGDRYENGGQVAPESPSTTSYAGSIELSGDTYLPKGWSYTVPSAGVINVNHGLQNNRYAVMAMANDGSLTNVKVVRVAKAINGFDIFLTDSSNTPTTADCSFTLTETKPAK